MFESGERGKRVTELWAYIAVDPHDDCEGIPAVNIPDPATRQPTSFPLVGADEYRMRSLRPIAVELAKLNGCLMRLVRFTNMEVIEEIKL